MKPPLSKDALRTEEATPSHRSYNPLSDHPHHSDPIMDSSVGFHSDQPNEIAPLVDPLIEGQPQPAYDLPQHHATNPLINNLIFLLVGCMLTFAATYVTRQPELPAIQLQPPPTPAPTAQPVPTATPQPFTIFVSGAVQAPGLYEVQDGARVGDVLAMAGGYLEDADSSLINQAERLFDGAQIHVPIVVELTVTEFESEPDLPSSPPLLVNQPPAGISGSSAPAQTGSSASNSGGLINVNTASAAELETLPGVGASRAAEIIAGRPYATVDDLQKVSGIGVKTVEKLRPLVTVD